MIRYFYRNIRGKELRELDDYKPGAWVYVEAPSDVELAALTERFKLEPGYLEDALDEDEVPRLESDNGLIYIYTRYAVDMADGQVETTPLMFVVGKETIITVCLKPLPFLSKLVNGRLEINTTQRTKLVLQLMSQIVERYDFYLNATGRRIKTIRSRLRGHEIRNEDFVDFVLLEDQLNDFLSALTPTNAILRRLLLGKHLPLFADDEDLVEDLLLNNEQSIEGCRANLKTIVNIREAYSTIMSNNLNRTIRILTIATVLLAVPTLIGSFYGMNIRLPFENATHTFAGIVVLSLLLCVLLLWIFRRKRLL